MPSEVKAQDTTSLASIKTVNEAATQSRALLAGMERAAAEADTTLNGIYQDAKDAQTAADSAKESADTAFSQLSVIENIVGVLNMVAERGEYAPAPEDEVQPDKWYFVKITEGKYQMISEPESIYHLTEDTTIDITKTYYTRSGTGTEEDPYVYTVVDNPDVSEISTYYEKYYVLVGIDEAIQNYVSSHLVLVGDTLSLRTDGSDYRLDLTAGGMQIVGKDGKPLATYGTDTIIGKSDKFHVKIDGEELGFYDGTVKVAYIRNDQLFIKSSVVLDQMDIGYPYGEVNPSTGETGKGQWSWKVHDVNGKNNLYLKWLG